MLEHLTKDTADTPHVNGRGIASELQKEFRRTVPSGDDQSSVITCSFTSTLTWLRWLVIIRSGEAEIGDLKDAFVADENVGGLHVSMQDFVLVKIGAAREELFHVALDLRFGEGDGGVLEQARQIVFHVERHHEHAGLLVEALGSFHSHFFEFEDVDVIELFEEFDFAEGGDGEAILLVVHQNLLEGHHLACLLRFGLGDLTKGSFSQLADVFVFLDSRTAAEAPFGRHLEVDEGEIPMRWVF
jgi:hypothetical protein